MSQEQRQELFGRVKHYPPPRDATKALSPNEDEWTGASGGGKPRPKPPRSSHPYSAGTVAYARGQGATDERDDC